MKKFLPAALVILILFNSAGYVFTYWQLKTIFKQTALKKIEQTLPENQLILIITSLDGNPLDSKNCVRENDKEFSLNDEMYDIVRSKIKGELIYHYCLKDGDENHLETAFINYVEGNLAIPKGTVPVKNIINSLSVDWEQLNKEILFITVSEKLVPTAKPQIIFIYIPVSVPPPKISSC